TLQLLRARGGWERRRAAARRRFIFAVLGVHEPFALDPIQGLIERAAEAVEQFVDLRRRDDERRTDRYDIADEEAHDQPLLFGAAHGARPDPGLRLEGVFALLGGENLDSADEP